MRLDLVRINESNFSLVQTIISEFSIDDFSLSLSPIANPTFKSVWAVISRNSLIFSCASAFNGTTYTAF